MPFGVTAPWQPLGTGDTLNFMSMIGMVFCWQYAKKNSIIPVDYTNQLRSTASA